MDNLKQQTLYGIFWALLERIAFRSIQFLPSILMARLLSPKEFGVVGMIMIFLLLAQTFLDGGFGTAIIQKKNSTHVDECSIFYFNILVGMILTLGIYVTAPLIARFYAEPLLTPLTRWLSLDILLKSFSLIQTTLLTRSLDFKTQIKANVLANLFGGVAGVTAAYAGLGIWSIVIQTLVASALRTTSLWFLNPWRPSWSFSLESLRNLFIFGSNMLFSSLLGTFFDNLYPVFIGKVFSASALGYYTRANSLKMMVIDTTSSTLSRVLFPAMASIQDDTERLRQLYRKSILLITFVHFPLMLGLVATAQPLINLLFSEKWHESILYFQLLCLAGLLYPMSVINLDVLKVKGRSDLFFRLELVKRAMTVMMILLTMRWGIVAMLIGQIISSIVNYFLNAYFTKQLIGYPISTQIADIAPNLGISVLTTGAMFLLSSFVIVPDWALLLIQASGGILVFLSLAWLVKLESWGESLFLLRAFTNPLT